MVCKTFPFYGFSFGEQDSFCWLVPVKVSLLITVDIEKEKQKIIS